MDSPDGDPPHARTDRPGKSLRYSRQALRCTRLGAEVRTGTTRSRLGGRGRPGIRSRRACPGRPAEGHNRNRSPQSDPDAGIGSIPQTPAHYATQSEDARFDSLANVQKLFTYEWTALAGWIHYLAFDLFIGAYAARRLIDAGCSRWWLVAVLPLIFMFGPIGFLAAELVLVLSRPLPTTI